jgi:hypothetical protein
MKTFTIDTDNNISAFTSKKQAAAASTTPFDPFTSQRELALAADWSATRLVETWNGIPGVTAVTRFTNRKIAIERIWKAIQNLGAEAEPTVVQPRPVDTVANGGEPAPDVAPAEGNPATKPTREKRAPKAPRTAALPKAGGVREGSKTASVIALLKRPNGTTLEEIMDKMGWQKHTVRGFMAGAMKKAGHTVESFKSEKGERTYRINQ